MGTKIRTKSRYNTKNLRKVGLSIRKIGRDPRVNRGKTTVERILKGWDGYSKDTIDAVMRVIREAEHQYRRAA